MFSRQAKGDGTKGDIVSINQPVHISTMMASGFIFVKTLSVLHKDIVCLDARGVGENIQPRRIARRLCWLPPEDLEHREYEEGSSSSSARKCWGSDDEPVKRAGCVRRKQLLWIIISHMAWF
jgi:hypothetical protein